MRASVARWVDTNGDGNSDREEFYVYDGDDVVFDFVDADGVAGGLSPVLEAVPARAGRRSDPGPGRRDQEHQADDRVLWMLTDNLGSVRDIVDNTGAGVSHMTYDAFGNITGGTCILLTRYLWTGRERESHWAAIQPQPVVRRDAGAVDERGSDWVLGRGL